MTVIALSERKIEQNQRRFLQSYIQCVGNISKACHLANISRETHYRWLREDSEYSEGFKETECVLIDNLEQSVLMSAMVDPKIALAVLERLRPEKWNKAVVADTAMKHSLITDNKIEVVMVDAMEALDHKEQETSDY